MLATAAGLVLGCATSDPGGSRISRVSREAYCCADADGVAAEDCEVIDREALTSCRAHGRVGLECRSDRAAGTRCCRRTSGGPCKPVTRSARRIEDEADPEPPKPPYRTKHQRAGTVWSPF